MMRRRMVGRAVVGSDHAVVVGTAGAVSHHQQQKYAGQEAAAQQQADMQDMQQQQAAQQQQLDQMQQQRTAVAPPHRRPHRRLRPPCGWIGPYGAVEPTGAAPCFRCVVGSGICRSEAKGSCGRVSSARDFLSLE